MQLEPTIGGDSGQRPPLWGTSASPIVPSCTSPSRGRLDKPVRSPQAHKTHGIAARATRMWPGYHTDSGPTGGSVSIEAFRLQWALSLREATLQTLERGHPVGFVTEAATIPQNDVDSLQALAS